jgi:UDP-glucose 4-epimerase
MTNLLITGATGFVGRQLCLELGKRGIDYAAVVRTGQHAAHSRVIDGITQATDWQQALVGIDVIVHLAARVHVMNDTETDPLAAFRAVNVDATLNLARQAAAAGVKRLVFVSSVKVNGEATHGTPFTALDSPAPEDAYGISKHEAEQGLRLIAEQTGLEVVIVRPPLVYGPGVRANFLRLMQVVRLGLPLPFGAVHNARSMVALDNLVDLLITCSIHPAAAQQTFMVSDGDDVSLTRLLRLMAQALDKRIWLVPIPAGLMLGSAALLGKSSVASRLLGSLQVDIAHTRDMLGWHPVCTVEDAIRQTAAALTPSTSPSNTP